MANKIKINLPAQLGSADLLNAGMYGTAAVLRVQWAASATGTFADLSGTDATPTVALVSGQETYSAFDPSGDAARWYRSRIENTGGTRLSDWSVATPTIYV
jgi:hypothetical protein